MRQKEVILGYGDEILAHEGLTAEVAEWEDGLRADPGPGYYEWWYFDAHFDDGSTAVVVYMTKSLLNRRAPLDPHIQLTITTPDGRKMMAFPAFPPTEFSASRERCDVSIGPNWVRGDLHRYELHVAADNLAADLVFTGRVPPWRPGSGKAYYSPDLSLYSAWLPAIPFGDVEGTLSYDGERHQVQGNGYHDHNWGNVDLGNVMSYWYWGRAHVGDFTTIFVEQVSSKQYGYQRIPVFMLAKGDEILTGNGMPLTMQVGDVQKHPGGRKYPRLVDFHWQEGNDEVHLALRNPEMIEAADLLLALPAWKRILLRPFIKPYYFRFTAALELQVNMGGLRATEQGSALYEIMLLR